MLKEKSNDVAVKIAMLEKQKVDIETAQKIFASEKKKIEDTLAQDKKTA